MDSCPRNKVLSCLCYCLPSGTNVWSIYYTTYHIQFHVFCFAANANADCRNTPSLHRCSASSPHVGSHQYNLCSILATCHMCVWCAAVCAVRCQLAAWDCDPYWSILVLANRSVKDLWKELRNYDRHTYKKSSLVYSLFQHNDVCNLQLWNILI